jgi:hypothetical protein
MKNSDVLELPREIAGIRVPDSALAREATVLAREASPAMLFNHVLRTYAFGGLVAARQGMKYDEELFYVGAVLHDLGLTEAYAGPERFEVVGANAADAFLKARGMPAERRAIVWDAIALHTSLGIASRKQPEIALVHIGAGVDVAGFGVEDMPGGIIERILEQCPRLDFKQAMFQTFKDLSTKYPEGTMLTFVSETARAHVPGYSCPTFEDLLLNAPFAE